MALSWVLTINSGQLAQRNFDSKQTKQAFYQKLTLFKISFNGIKAATDEYEHGGPWY